jgi:hypothetical protein
VALSSKSKDSDTIDLNTVLLHALAEGNYVEAHSILRATNKKLNKFPLTQVKCKAAALMERFRSPQNDIIRLRAGFDFL